MGRRATSRADRNGGQATLDSGFLPRGHLSFALRPRVGGWVHVFPHSGGSEVGGWVVHSYFSALRARVYSTLEAAGHCGHAELRMVVRFHQVQERRTLLH
eukprot:5398464-Prymnesium_polylepis.1